MFAVLAVILAFFIYFLNTKFMAYGLEFTDEGFYLNWISDPFSYEYGISNFGFFYYPFFKLLNENIVFLRQFNVFLIGGLSFFVAFIALGKFIQTVGRKEKLLLSFALSSLSLSLYSGTILFNPTPSYNDLNFIGLLVVLAGWLIGVEAKNAKLIFVSSFLIALGGLLLFHAKPSTAVLVGFAMLLIMLIRSNKRVFWVSTSFVIFLVLLLLTSFYISSGPMGLIERYITAYEIQSYLKSGHEFFSLIRFDDFSFGKRTWLYFLLLFAFLVTYFYLENGDKSVVWHNSILFLLIGFLIYYVDSGQFFNAGYYQGVFLLLLSLSPLVYFYTVSLATKSTPSIKENFLILICFILVYSYAFGTNNNYFIKYHIVFFFFALAGSVLLRNHISLRSALVFIIVLQSVLILNLTKSYEYPYRQPQPLLDNTSHTKVHTSQLLLEKNFSDYIMEVGVVKSKTSATNYIDLSGQMPTLAYVLDLKPIGVAWLLGGYPGSYEFAYQVLSKAGCRRFENAILLYESDGPRSIDISLLSEFGLDLERDFELVHQTSSPAGAGGYQKPRKQYFYYSKTQNIKRYCNAPR
ncbi:MAG: hypothetical protein RI556_08770 [Hydrogenovibrio sp.]|uniref:hypothetical protein n=1 Tax=Hydrogenovibrio sp. TaxID=2065821 RepID=UPI0028704A1E|nr:hypothetical protein [Hydrogenovibrio sp.]MDR9498516.1 hypothetical protein [Hydrogenovibrio sp.]MDR9499254.1 hypothetical protein [Hydrogenovibrio sp.]